MLGRDLSSRGLSLAGAGLPALAPADLDVAAGEHVALLERGDGAAFTLLRLIAGFARPDLGRVAVGGRDVTDHAPGDRPSVLVAADLPLFAAATVTEIVDLAGTRRAPARPERRARTAALLARFDLAAVADRRPGDLDASQAARLALARAVAAEPALLLLDRPFLGVPVSERADLRDRLDEIRRRDGPTVIERCDDPAEAFARADRVAAFVAERLVQIDTPDRIWSAPASLAVARLGGVLNVLPGRLSERDGPRGRVDTSLGPLPGTLLAEARPGDAVTVAIRPERIDVAEIETTPARIVTRLDADFVERRLIGPSVRHVFAVGDHRLVVVRPDRGLHRLLLAGRTTLTVSADDVWIHPAASGGDAGG